MKCPISFREIPQNEWRSLMDALQRVFDELYRFDEIHKHEGVRNGQLSEVFLQQLVLLSTPGGKRMLVEPDDTDPANIEWRITDLGGR